MICATVPEDVWPYKNESQKKQKTKKTKKTMEID